METSARIYIAGHQGLVGSAITDNLKSAGFNNLLFATRQALDLRNQERVEDFFATNRPDYVFLAAAKVGGIYANNTFPAEFIYDNLMIQTNIIHACFRYGVKKLLFLGSSCIYPKFAVQPLREDDLLSGRLEPTNEAYAIAKIAGLKMCQAYNHQFHTHYITVMPSNLYGPRDNFDPKSSHVLPAMLRKFHEAKITHAPSVELWGTGTPRREFLHVDDLVRACLFLMENYDENKPVNIGAVNDVTIAELAEIIKKITGYRGNIVWNKAMPDGTPRKLLDISKMKRMGWEAKISLEVGIKRTYEWFLRQPQFQKPSGIGKRCVPRYYRSQSTVNQP